MISDFKIFPIMLLRQLNFGELLVYQLFYVYYKAKTLLFLNLLFLLLLSERGLSNLVKISWQFAIRVLVVYKLVAYKKSVLLICDINFILFIYLYIYLSVYLIIYSFSKIKNFLRILTRNLARLALFQHLSETLLFLTPQATLKPNTVNEFEETFE